MLQCVYIVRCRVGFVLQYIPRNMHTVFALLCFVVVIHCLIFQYPSGLLHWHCDNLTIAPVPAKQPWWIWINTSCEFIMNDCITTTKQSTTKPCAYFLGYTVYAIPTLQWKRRKFWQHSTSCVIQFWSNIHLYTLNKIYACRDINSCCVEFVLRNVKVTRSRWGCPRCMKNKHRHVILSHIAISIPDINCVIHLRKNYK